MVIKTSPYGQILLDVSVEENHGELYPISSPYTGPNITWGRHGYGLEFDGVDDYVRVSDDASLDITAEITLSAWVLVKFFEDGDKIIYKHNAYSLEIDSLGVAVFKIYSDGWHSVKTKTNVMTTNTYYHLAGGYNQSHLLIYVNGNLTAAEYLLTKPIATTTHDLYIGSTGSTGWFEGVIDEVRIYPFAQSKAHIFTDKVTPIRVHNQHSMVRSYNNVQGWVKGLFNPAEVYFINNDPDLPYTRNDTYPLVKLERIRYIPGFQNYRFYATIAPGLTYAYQNPPVSWEWEFVLFRLGQRATAFLINITLTGEVYSGDIWDHQVRVQFAQWYNDQWNIKDTTKLNYARTNVTEFKPTMFDLIIDAWVGVDKHHFTTRVSLDAENRSGMMIGPSSPFSASYGFELIDNDGKKHILDWFDGYVLKVIRVNNANESSAGIYSHGLVLTVAVIIIGIVVGALVYQYVVRPYLAETMGWHLPPIPGLPEKPEDLIAAIIAGFSTALRPVIQALTPIWDALQEVGKYIVQAMLDFVDVAIGFLDGVFTAFGWPDGFSQLLGWLGDLMGWLMVSFDTLVKLLTTFYNIVSGLITPLTHLLTVIGVFITNIWLAVNGMLTWLNNAYNDAVLPLTPLITPVLTLIGVILPFWELARMERYGFGVLFDDLNKVIDVTAFLMNTFIQVIHFFIRILTAIIESIPVVE